MISIRVNSIKELFQWLEKNHTTTESVWLEYQKKSSGGLFSMNEIIDELLCWGWIDSLPKKVDDTWTSVRISPRNPKSRWSKINKDKISKLEEQGRIQPSGYQSIAIAKENGSWNALDDVEKLILPDDFRLYLTEHDLMSVWETKNRSYKRGFLEQLLDAKKPETREKKFRSME
jgi:uncharacterized protein YdeI (YjbR/CyaY-like superfamily)